MNIAKLVATTGAASLFAGAAYAAVMTAAPADSWTVTNYYKQAVYDPNNAKVGDVEDVLVDKDGKVTGLVISVGGFLGMGEKEVIVPFADVSVTKKENKWWLTVSETKDSLKAAPGFTYNRETTMWQPTKS